MNGRVAAVLGVGPGLGAALARRFAGEGFVVAIIGLGRSEAVGYPHVGAPVVVLTSRDPGYQELHEFAALLVSLGAVSLDLFHARLEP